MAQEKISVEHMTRIELEDEVRSSRVSIDFIMERVNDVVSENKILTEQLKDSVKVNDASWVRLRERRQTIEGLEEQLSAVQDMLGLRNRESVSLNEQLVTVGNEYDKRGTEIAGLEQKLAAVHKSLKKVCSDNDDLEDLNNKYEARFIKIDKELSTKTKKLLNQENTIIKMRDDLVVSQLEYDDSNKMVKYWHGVFDAEVEVNLNLNKDLKTYKTLNRSLRRVLDIPIEE